jgi:hypothetical protein
MPSTDHVALVFELPLTVAVNCFVWFTWTEAEVGEIATDTPDAPVPVSDTICGLLGSESVSVSVPVRVPVAVGVKVTLTLQLAPAATPVPQLFVCE